MKDFGLRVRLTRLTAGVKILTPPRHQRILLQAHFCARQEIYIRDIAA